ncbi:MAG: ferredoxin-NADP reductase [Oleiphilaceae bacterium]|jgi:ferredoxin-NADP reductase
MSTFIEIKNQPYSLKNTFEPLVDFLARSLTNKESFSAYFESVVQLFKPEWRYQKIAAKVISSKAENKNIYTLTLKPGNNWSGFQAGQYILLSTEINGRMLTRPFSISSAPRDFQETGFIEVTIRVQDNGSVTPWLRDNLKKRDYVYLSEAMGEFCLGSAHHQKVFIAGGSGITPIRSMLNDYRDSDWLKDAHLFFYLRNQDELFFKKDLERLQQKGMNVHLMFADEIGFFSIEQLTSELGSNNLDATDYYICGPGQMIELCTSSIESAGVNSSNIHFEYFGKAPIKIDINTSDDNEFIQVDYLNSRKQVKFTCGTVRKTLLELAEEEGLKPVSGCRMGICHQCICKKKQGRVFNTKTQEYSDSGAEEIQLCISIPVGAVELEL